MDAFRELPKTVELTFTSAWSNSIDGVIIRNDDNHIKKYNDTIYERQDYHEAVPKLKGGSYTVIEVLACRSRNGEEQTASENKVVI